MNRPRFARNFAAWVPACVDASGELQWILTVALEGAGDGT